MVIFSFLLCDKELHALLNQENKSMMNISFKLFVTIAFIEIYVKGSFYGVNFLWDIYC